MSRFTNLLRSVRAVLWAFIGLGGRRADADERLNRVHPLGFIVVALVLGVIFVAGLIVAARYAAGL